MREGGVGWLLGSLCGYAEAEEESGGAVVRLPAGTAARRAREAGGVNCDSRGGIARQVGPTGRVAFGESSYRVCWET